MKKEKECHHGKHHAYIKLVIGLALISWALWYPQVDWRLFFGVLLAALAIVKLNYK